MWQNCGLNSYERLKSPKQLLRQLTAFLLFGGRIEENQDVDGRDKPGHDAFGFIVMCRSQAVICFHRRSKKEQEMRRGAISLIASLIGATLLGAAPGHSQTPAPQSAAERRKALEERATNARMKIEQTNKERESILEARTDKRRACTKEAKQQKFSLLKRRRFVKDCMAR
ncbi:MAG: hypothetical protein ACR2K5_02910 [Pseudolabrys sp.]